MHLCPPLFPQNNQSVSGDHPVLFLMIVIVNLEPAFVKGCLLFFLKNFSFFSWTRNSCQKLFQKLGRSPSRVLVFTLYLHVCLGKHPVQGPFQRQRQEKIPAAVEQVKRNSRHPPGKGRRRPANQIGDGVQGPKAEPEGSAGHSPHKGGSSRLRPIKRTAKDHRGQMYR